jgi:hypothetical protein
MILFTVHFQWKKKRVGDVIPVVLFGFFFVRLQSLGQDQHSATTGVVLCCVVLVLCCVLLVRYSWRIRIRSCGSSVPQNGKAARAVVDGMTHSGRWCDMMGEEDENEVLVLVTADFYGMASVTVPSFR